LWVSLNLGYRYYARHLHEKTGPIYRDSGYMAEAAARIQERNTFALGEIPAGRSCGSVAPSAFVEVGATRRLPAESL